jgi:biopolymer transport protein TolR
MQAPTAGGSRFGMMNVTPLIDVLLTLLVIFMVISPVTPLGERALIPQPPPKHSKPQQSNRSVILQLVAVPGAKPQIKINQQDVSWPDLINRLNQIYETRAERVLFVKADDNVSWQNVATVIDEAHYAGVDKVGLITAKIEASG